MPTLYDQILCFGDRYLSVYLRTLLNVALRNGDGNHLNLAGEQPFKMNIKGNWMLLGEDSQVHSFPSVATNFSHRLHDR